MVVVVTVVVIVCSFDGDSDKVDHGDYCRDGAGCGCRGGCCVLVVIVLVW